MGADDDRRQRAIQLREAGATLREIKRELAIGSTKLAQWLSGVVPPARAPASDDPLRWSERRHRAHELRLQGRSYREIERLMGVAKSTQSSWFRDVPLTDEHRRRLQERKAGGGRSGADAVRSARLRRTEIVHETAAAEVGAIGDRELFLLGVIAYWCEGSKAKPWSPSQSVSFINSDPRLIRLFLRWLERLGYGPDDLICKLSIHECADLEGATSFWEEQTEIPRQRFRPPTLKRHQPKTVRRNVREDYVGCFVIDVRRSTELNRRIAGWFLGIAQAIDAVPGTLEGDSAVV